MSNANIAWWYSKHVNDSWLYMGNTIMCMNMLSAGQRDYTKILRIESLTEVINLKCISTLVSSKKRRKKNLLLIQWLVSYRVIVDLKN
jgi:hypothetical protein